MVFAVKGQANVADGTHLNGLQIVRDIVAFWAEEFGVLQHIVLLQTAFGQKAGHDEEAAEHLGQVQPVLRVQADHDIVH